MPSDDDARKPGRATPAASGGLGPAPGVANARLKAAFVDSLREIAAQGGHPDDVARRILDLRETMIRGILRAPPSAVRISPAEAAEDEAVRKGLLRAVHEAANAALNQIGRPPVPDDQAPTSRI